MHRKGSCSSCRGPSENDVATRTGRRREGGSDFSQSAIRHEFLPSDARPTVPPLSILSRLAAFEGLGSYWNGAFRPNVPRAEILARLERSRGRVLSIGDLSWIATAMRIKATALNFNNLLSRSGADREYRHVFVDGIHGNSNYSIASGSGSSGCSPTKIITVNVSGSTTWAQIAAAFSLPEPERIAEGVGQIVGSTGVSAFWGYDFDVIGDGDIDDACEDASESCEAALLEQVRPHVNGYDCGDCLVARRDMYVKTKCQKKITIVGPGCKSIATIGGPIAFCLVIFLAGPQTFKIECACPN
jgi:hypothetical protein